ncbi:MAG: hypothetical protein AABZ47_16225 [Planctomycetota bacterium]
MPTLQTAYRANSTSLETLECILEVPPTKSKRKVIRQHADCGFGHGIASVASTNADFTAGSDAGADSGSAYVFNLVCDPGYYGPMCAGCPGGASNPCNGNGTCDDGPSGTGQCTCNSGFVGVACEDCRSGLFGPNCEPCPGGACNPCCGNGTCDDGISGSGTCTCNVGYGGPACCVITIPAVSTWGIFILLLLLTTAGTIVLCPRARRS